MNNTNFIIHEPADEYHARSRNGEFMSSHLLADFRESPALYRRKVSGEIAESESSAFVMGRAAHCLILEGRNAFDREYVVTHQGVCGMGGDSGARNHFRKGLQLSPETAARRLAAPHRVGTAGGRNRGRCGSGRVLFRSLPDPDGLVQHEVRTC